MVLIITQNESFGRYLTEWLDTKGYPCSMACDGWEGLKRAQEDGPKVVVVDLYAKEPSGMDVLRQLREQGFSGKVILMGGVSVSQMVPEALRLGVDQVIGGEAALGPLECAIQSAFQSLSPQHDTEQVEEPSSAQQT